MELSKEKKKYLTLLAEKYPTKDTIRPTKRRLDQLKGKS